MTKQLSWIRECGLVLRHPCYQNNVGGSYVNIVNGDVVSSTMDLMTRIALGETHLLGGLGVLQMKMNVKFGVYLN